MPGTSAPDPAAVFDPLRPKLARIAYRMLGSVADAEDVVQDAFLRWMATDRGAVREPEGFLRRIVTRLCLDQLKSARRRREVYPGEWLPEPVLEDEDDEADDVTLPLMMALERLSPLERAAFILHDVFGVEFRRGCEDDRPRSGGHPPACRPRAQPCARGPAALRRAEENMVSKSPKPSSQLRAMATCRRCRRCSPRMCPCIPTAAERSRRR